MQIKQNAVMMMFAAAVLAGGVGLAGCKSTDTRQSTGEVVDDSATTAKVKTALMRAQDVPWTAINVETYRGVVSLSGFVNTDDEVQRALTAARTVDGVKSVKNDLHVKPPAKQ